MEMNTTINMESLSLFVGQLTVENFLLKSQMKQLEDKILQLVEEQRKKTKKQTLTDGDGTFASAQENKGV